MSRARKGGRSVEQRVWSFLRRQEAPCRSRVIEEGLNMSTRAVNAALGRLRDKGCVVSTGATNNRLHAATAKRPDDMRGTALGTLRALQEHSVVNRQAAATPSPPRVRYGTELERAWRIR